MTEKNRKSEEIKIAFRSVNIFTFRYVDRNGCR